MKKYNDFITESITDKMTPVTEEDLKKSFGEDKYNQYKKLIEVKKTMDKAPFSTSDVYFQDDPMVVKIFSELNEFIIKYINNK